MRLLLRSIQTYPLRYLALVVAAAFALTLYPFNFFQRNQVSFSDGMTFALPGTAYTLHAHEALSFLYQFTFFLRVTPALDDAPRVMRIMGSGPDFYNQNFSIGQYRNQLVIQFFSRDSKQFNEITVPEVFREKEPVWIALTFNGTTVRCYVDGRKKAERRTGPMALTQWDSTYPIVFGTDPAGLLQWEGTVHTAAIYDRAFKASEVRRPDLIFRKYSSIIHYHFGRRTGQYVASRGTDRDSVFVPALFKPYNRSTLFDPFRLLGRQRLYVRDIVANIIFFLPVGLFSALALRRSITRFVVVLLLSAAAGMALSISVETLQIFLSSRFSSIVDVLSNTAGTVIGACITLVLPRRAGFGAEEKK
ncbi:MAG: VanZ family protein [Acidobacteriota bacterium]